MLYLFMAMFKVTCANKYLEQPGLWRKQHVLYLKRGASVKLSKAIGLYTLYRYDTHL